MKMVWHYAPWSYLPAIVESGALKASNAGAPGEVPMLWFSGNQQWEPTATKVVDNGVGGISQLTFNQQAERFGCIRFGLAANDLRLLSWQNSCSVAGMSRSMQRDLERVGKMKGADPKHWFATSLSIQLHELHFQVWTGAWNDASSTTDMAEVWTEIHG